MECIGKPMLRRIGKPMHSRVDPVARLHPPAMVEEVLEWLGCRQRPDGFFADCTTGTGGHALAILEATRKARLICLDRDAESLQVSQERLKAYAHRTQFMHTDFRRLDSVLENLGVAEVDGCLIDAGMSLWQVDSPERGLSFRADAFLDMRFDRTQPTTAADLVNQLSQNELARLLRQYADERWAWRIAAAIATQRRSRPITTTAQLAAIVTAAIPAKHRPRNVHPATKTFAALRAAVNEELEALAPGATVAARALAKGGRLVILTYSSSEDRTVKSTFRSLARRGGHIRALPGEQQPTSSPPLALFQVLTKKPLTPAAAEVRSNPRARGAKLRALERSL